MPFDNENRVCRLAASSNLPSYFVRSLRGREAISEPFWFDLEVMSTATDESLADRLGSSVTFELLLSSGAVRSINGLVAQMKLVSADVNAAVYRIRLVPWLWMLEHRTDSRVFQELTVPEIIDKVLEPYQFAELDPRLDKEYETRLHCVQYQESDAAFITRLLEEEGIAYHFEHEDGRHVMVLCDSPDLREPCSGHESVMFMDARSENASADDLDEVIREWHLTEQLQSGSFLLGDFNYHDPGTSLSAPGTGRYQTPVNERLERYVDPGGFVKLGAEDAEKMPFGEVRADLAAERADVSVRQARGQSDCRGFTAGTVFELLNHDRTDCRGQWLLLAVEHELDQSAALSTTAAGAPGYENRFEVLPAEVPFRPELRTPRPVMQGPQTAIVTGPDGEEIHTDRLGRIKVCFHWDRYGARDGSDSCWVRVAQSWAGGGWGAQFVPRIGHEVVIEFLEGDPDRPLCTGSVYNGRNAIPFDKPTQSGIRTRTSKEGSSQNGNEIRFEDLKDQEELFVQAERNYTLNVKKASNTSVGTNAGSTVQGNNTTTVKGNETAKVEGNREATVDGNQTTTVKTDDTLNVTGKHNVNVTGDQTVKLKANGELKATGNQKIEAAEITLTGKTKIRLEVGGSYIEITAAGVTVHGTQATVEGVAEAKLTGPIANVEGTTQATVSSPVTSVSGSGTVTISGGMVNIN
jgi:type VI secretion system secreted protein VgrG